LRYHSTFFRITSLLKYTMARLSPKQLEEELKKQNELYGDGEDQLGGSATDPEADDDTKKELEDEIGHPVDPDQEGFSIGETINEEEEERHGLTPPESYDTDDII